MVAMMQTWVQDEAEYCDFPQILAEIADYDAITLDSDNDAADALGFALMRDVDMKRVPVDNRAEEEINKAFDCPIWNERADGSMVDITEPEILNTFAGHYEPDDYVGEF
jgi:hypothetical protein